MTTTLFQPDTDELEKLSNLPTELALQRAAPFLAHLVRDPVFLVPYVLPLLQEARTVKDWYVAHTYDGQDGSYSLQVFVWPPGTRTQIHDHTSWGAYCCVVGSVLEERWNALMTARSSRRLKEGVAAVVEQRGRGLEPPTIRGGYPPGRQPWQQESDLRTPLRPQDV